MKKIKDKIEQVELKIYDKCPESVKDIIHTYWEFDNNYVFNYSPTQVIEKYGLDKGKLIDTISEFSNLSIYLKCGTCNEIERNSFTSQTAFRNFSAKIRRLKNNKYKCRQCQAVEEEALNKAKLLDELERKRKRDRELAEKMRLLNQAVDEKRWENLTAFEDMVLKNAIILNDIRELNKYYIAQGVKARKMLDSAIKILAGENLIYLEFDSWDKSKIVGYRFLPRLIDEYSFQSKPNKVIYDKTNHRYNDKSNIVELHLTPAYNQIHPTSPAFDTTFKFEKDVIFKAGEEFSCQLINKIDGNVTIVIKPTESGKNKVKGLDLESLPKELRDQLLVHLKKSDKG